MITRDEAVAFLLGDKCADCASKVTPGTPCGACGRIPDLTGPELDQYLDGPAALAAVEAKRLRDEAWAEHDAAVGKMEAADRAVYLARLEVRRNQAQRALDEHQRAHKSLYGPRAAARKAEEKAADELASATAEHDEYARAHELARRMRHGVKAETEAATKLDRATGILRGYQDALAQAAARRLAAEAAVDQSGAKAEVLERARDQAVAEYATPGRVPLSAETITLGGVRLVLSRELDDVEMLMAGVPARQICALTGMTADIEADVRRQVAAEQDAGKKSKPLALAPLGRGNAVAAANPAHQATPRPWDAPATPRNPVVPGGLPTGF